eukprot:scaffold4766_cov115-Isochrysis_galbana.AAC.5
MHAARSGQLEFQRVPRVVGMLKGCKDRRGSSTAAARGSQGGRPAAKAAPSLQPLHARRSPAPAGDAAEVGGGEAEAHSPNHPAVSSEPTLGPRAAQPYEEAARAATRPSHRLAQPLRSRMAAPTTRSEPRPSPPPKWGASPPSGTARPGWQVSPVEPSEEPWQALLLTEELTLLSLVTPHRPEGSAGPRTTRRVGTLVAARMAPADLARAGAWQPACAELAITIGLCITMLWADGAGSGGRSACRASISSAACGCASGRRLQLERPTAPAAACTCPAREAASAIARALPSFVCVESWRENQNRSSGKVPII